MTRKNLSFFLGAMTIMLSLSVLSCGRGTADLGVSGRAPDFTLRTLDGENYNFHRKTAGKVVILNFWAERCPACREEIPAFRELYGRYRDMGLEIIGIDVDAIPAERAKIFAERNNIGYTLLTGDRPDISEVAAAYGPIRYIPATFIIDRDGRIAERVIGARSKAYFEDAVKELL